MRKLVILSVPIMLLSGASGCAPEAEGDTAEQLRDPLFVQALNAPLMTDPDLASLNEANAALTVGFDHSLPPIDRSSETIAAAQNAMRIALIEGGEIPALPAAKSVEGTSIMAGTLSAGQRAAAAGLNPKCARGLDYSAIWAARLPDYAQIVPRGAVVEAAGSDATGCKVRVVRYLTPLAVEDLLTFNFTLAKRAGLSPQIRDVDGESGEKAIYGTSAKGDLAMHVVARNDGLTSADVITVLRD